MLAVSGWAEENKKPEPYSPELVKRAEAGDAKAQWSLGGCYLYGSEVAVRFVVDKDEKEAMKWFTKSAEQGDEDAKKDLEKVKSE